MMKSFFLNTILPLIYKKSIRKKNGLLIVEKRKFLGLTFFKQTKSDKEIKTIFLKFIHFTKPLSEKEYYLTVNEEDFGIIDLPTQPNTLPLVSVIVPNYNHAPYLRERLESIYRQTYKNIEVILLDDASSDNSAEILTEYTQKYPDKTRLIINQKNSGKVFHQWNKGLELARGEFIWIAESDDYCDLNFLEELLKGLFHQSVLISFARSIFMQNGKKIWSQEQYLQDLPINWNKAFIMTAHTLVNKGFGIKNIIPNVSSAVFRNVGTIPNAITEIWNNMSLCGDWLFYLWLIRGGSVSYTNSVTNYYRIHSQSTSLKVQKTLNYYLETFQISCFVAQNYAINPSIFEVIKNNLIRHYKSHFKSDNIDIIEEIYNISEIIKHTQFKKPNVLIGSYALIQGGGEIFPIYLANELKRQGIPVTFIDFRNAIPDENIRCKLNRDVPLIELNEISYLKDLITLTGADIIHTHEGNMDKVVGRVIKNRDQSCKHIITLHGMYEAISQEHLNDILQYVLNSCSTFVYIANKNLTPVKEHISASRLIKIGNGLPQIPVTPHKRSELGIEENAFCLTLVSRAIRDKGWLEAVEAVQIAHKKSQRPIHLILIGYGECYEILKKRKLPPYIHLLGGKSDVRNYFAMSDMGLLPSKFKGESFPLVIIESLMSGVPVLATDLGEIRNMITSENGQMAGFLFNLENDKIPVQALANIIFNISSNSQLYANLKMQIANVIDKFDIKNIAKKYIEVYNTTLTPQSK